MFFRNNEWCGVSMHVIGLILFLLLSANDAVWAYSRISGEMAEDMSRTYSFVISQQYAVEKLSERFPEHRATLQSAQLAFKERFGGAAQNIDKVLMEELQDWPSLKEHAHSALGELFDYSTVDSEEVEKFSSELERRSKGELPSPVLEMLLTFHPSYIEQPEQEFRDGWLQRFTTASHSKAKGVLFHIDIPQSWRNREGDHPNIVQVFTSENGYGFESIMLQVKDLPFLEGRSFSPQEIAEFFSEKTAKEMIPPGGIFRGYTSFTIDGERAGRLTFDQTQERMGHEFFARTVIYYFLHENNLVSVQCHVGRPKEYSDEVYEKFRRLEPLFLLVGNSIVIEDKWVRESSELNSQPGTEEAASKEPSFLLTLVIGLALTWGWGLSIPLIIRYLIVRSPLNKMKALSIVSLLWLTNLILFILLGSESKSHAALFLVAVVSYYILHKGYKDPVKLTAPPVTAPILISKAKTQGSQSWHKIVSLLIMAKNKLYYNCPSLIPVVLLLGALTDDLPYAYYIVLRLTVCTFAIFYAHAAYQIKSKLWLGIFGAITVLFNPVFPIEMEEEDWRIIDIIASIIFTCWVFSATSMKGHRERVDSS